MPPGSRYWWLLWCMGSFFAPYGAKAATILSIFAGNSFRADCGSSGYNAVMFSTHSSCGLPICSRMKGLADFTA